MFNEILTKELKELKERTATIEAQLRTLFPESFVFSDDQNTTCIESFAERLKLLIGNRTARSFAVAINRSPSVIHQYLHGKSDPSRAVLSLIASKTGASLEWLVDGTGPMLKATNKKEETMNVGFCAQLSDKPCETSSSVARVRPLKERIDFDLELTEGAIKSTREHYKDWPEVLEALDEEIERRRKTGSMESPKKIAANLAKLTEQPKPPDMDLIIICKDGSFRIGGAVRISES